MTEKSITWEQDGIDSGWFFANDIGSVRSNASYRPGGWWFLAKWLPDTEEHDIGPFKTRRRRWLKRSALLPCSDHGTGQALNAVLSEQRLQ